MTEKRHEAVLKPEPARIAGFASIGLSFLAGLGNALRRFEKPSRPAGITRIRQLTGPQASTESVTERSRTGAA
jgi:hypothetical protein